MLPIFTAGEPADQYIVRPDSQLYYTVVNLFHVQIIIFMAQQDFCVIIIYIGWHKFPQHDTWLPCETHRACACLGSPVVYSAVYTSTIAGSGCRNHVGLLINYYLMDSYYYATAHDQTVMFIPNRKSDINNVASCLCRNFILQRSTIFRGTWHWCNVGRPANCVARHPSIWNPPQAMDDEKQPLTRERTRGGGCCALG